MAETAAPPLPPAESPPALPSMFRHIAVVAAGLGLVMGIVLFSVLLYVSDFGGRGNALEALAPAGPVQETPLAEDPRPVGLRWLQWVFGPPTDPPPQ